MSATMLVRFRVSDFTSILVSISILYAHLKPLQEYYRQFFFFDDHAIQCHALALNRNSSRLLRFLHLRHCGRMVSRLPRFKRVPAVPPMRLTERDRRIIRLIHRHRFLRSPQIVALLGGSTQQLLRRLKLLYHHRYLERPRAQIDRYGEGGSQHIIYGLGNKSRAFLKQELNVDFREASWGEKNRGGCISFFRSRPGNHAGCAKRINADILLPQTLAYEATWTQKVHQRKLGIHRFRVLTVTTNAMRVKSLLEACSRLKRGHGLFLFADRTVLEKDLFSPVWQCGKSSETAAHFGLARIGTFAHLLIFSAEDRISFRCSSTSLSRTVHHNQITTGVLCQKIKVR
jgi:hypothetical protein